MINEYLIKFRGYANGYKYKAKIKKSGGKNIV